VTLGRGAGLLVDKELSNKDESLHVPETKFFTNRTSKAFLAISMLPHR
jgi:hypothetical protein